MDEKFPVDPAGQATLRVPVLAPDATVGSARRLIIESEFDRVDEIAVVDNGRLAGLVGWRELFRASPQDLLSEVMDEHPVVLRPGSSEEEAAWHLARRGQANLAIDGGDGKFAGLIPAHVLLGRLLTELNEDSARLGGYLASESTARRSAEEPVLMRLTHRIPWLVLGLVGAMFSAVIVGSFEEQLSQKVLLAFFVPAVVYMADAVGTQTETLLIRAMSANVDIKRMVRREALTGILLGILIGLVFYPFALIGWGDQRVALAVAIALFASCSIATSVATILPRMLAHFGSDPAFGSGPLATIIQDLLSIAVYLVIATSIAT